MMQAFKQIPAGIYITDLWQQSPLACVEPLVISAVSSTVSSPRFNSRPSESCLQMVSKWLDSTANEYWHLSTPHRPCY